MVKTGVFKKFAALTAALTLIGSFAAGASAVSVATTTTYVAESGNTKVDVTANVSGLSGAVEVTYYATKGGNVVYVDQTTASNAGAAVFNYVTATSNLNSSVKVGYTDATAAEDTTVPGYTVTLGTGTEIVPTTNAGGTFVFPYSMPEGKQFVSVTSSGASVTSSSYSSGSVTVVLGTISADTTLTVNVEDAIVLNPSGSYVQGAAIVSNGYNDQLADGATGSLDGFEAAPGDRKLTVIGQVSDTSEYGIILSETAIDSGAVASLPSGEGTYTYEAKGKSDEGYFAVMVIDTGSGEDAIITPNTDYYTAIYYKNSNTNMYQIVAGADAVNAAN